MNGKMSLADALSIGLSTTIVGLSTVFLVLIVLMLVVMAMKYIFAEKHKKAKKNEMTVEPVITAEPEKNEEELIAVLTAAVAASLNTSTYNLKIKSYRRIASNNNAWQKAGLNESIGNRY